MARLTDKEMTELIKTGHVAGIGSDRLGIYLLEALRAEGSNPQVAISRYRRLIISAKEDGDHPFVVPAYLRLSDLLERAGRSTEALDVLDDFYMTVRDKKGPNSPTAAQSILTLSARRARLLRKLRDTYRLGYSPPTV
jgi:sugar/nucleoside kinase (ribokinase family)